MASKTQHLSIPSLELSNPLAEMRHAGLLWGSLHQLGLLWVCGAATGPHGLLLPEPLLVQAQGKAVHGDRWSLGNSLPALRQHCCFLLPSSHRPPLRLSQKDNTRGCSESTSQSRFCVGDKHLLALGVFRKEMEAECCSISHVTLAGGAAVPAVAGLWNTRTVHGPQWDVGCEGGGHKVPGSSWNLL